MEKNSFKWMKKIIGILIPLSLFSSLSMQIFADFAGDGIQGGDLMYPDSNISSFDISHNNGGSTNDIDNISFAPLPIYDGGSLISEVSRGVYGYGTNQFYRYTTVVTRNQGTITQKYDFDSPLFSSTTEMTLACNIPYVSNENMSFTINAVTNNTVATCFVRQIFVDYDQVSLLSYDNSYTATDRFDWEVFTIYNHVSLRGQSPSGDFPYTFTLGDWVEPDISGQFIVNLRVRFEIEIAFTGLFSLSYTTNYSTSSRTPPNLLVSGSADLIVKNVIVEPVFMDDIPFVQTVINTFQDIGEIQLFGVFTIGDIMWAFIGIGLLVVFLKFFAGG